MEVQFLLQIMLIAKKEMHQMYYITRNVQFRNNISYITSISENKQQKLYFLIHAGQDNKEGIENLATFLMTYLDDIDLAKLDTKGMSIFHYLAKLGKVKMLKLLENVISKQDCKKYLNMQDSSVS